MTTTDDYAETMGRYRVAIRKGVDQAYKIAIYIVYIFQTTILDDTHLNI